MAPEPGLELAPHLTYTEIACPCCGLGFCTMDLLLAWTSLRLLVDSPILVFSGFRCASRNREVNGSPTTKHLSGKALDISVVSLEPSDELWTMILRSGFTGIGRGVRLLHVDVRDRPYFWTYGADGGVSQDATMHAFYDQIAGV